MSVDLILIGEEWERLSITLPNSIRGSVAYITRGVLAVEIASIHCDYAARAREISIKKGKIAGTYKLKSVKEIRALLCLDQGSDGVCTPTETKNLIEFNI